MKVVLVDVDGTLLAGPHSSEALFIRHLLRHGHLGPRQLGAAGWFMARHGLRYGRHVFRKNKCYLAGLRLADIAAMADTFAKERLQRIVNRPLLRRIEEHRAEGARIMLLTGTPEFLAAPLARIVGADGLRAARYSVRNGIFLAEPPVEHPLGADKVLMAATMCEGAGASLAEAAVYADLVHDLPLLLQAGRPVAVLPDAGLKREACARGWEIMEARPDDDTGMGSAARPMPESPGAT